jgi:hypothetical protein
VEVATPTTLLQSFYLIVPASIAYYPQCLRTGSSLLGLISPYTS